MKTNHFKSQLNNDQPLRLSQSRLDILDRSRRSRLPWRGQFSPEFVEYLMEIACGESTRFYDPFCGSGTVLYEAMQLGHNAVGLEVNPAAWHLGVLSSFTSLPDEERMHILFSLHNLVDRNATGGMFDGTCLPPLQIINTAEHLFLRLAVAAAVLLGMGNGSELTSSAIARGSFAVAGLLKELEKRHFQTDCFLSDARKSPLQDCSVDAVITSPPYINVFNYHQNYRPAVELLGWKPLQAAPSEIGANRKHRMNRFLTVVQYCIDIRESLMETARVMIPAAPLIIVLGRTSNVLGASFRNGDIIRELLCDTGCFDIEYQAERVFTNRFGERIYEDIFFSRRRHEIIRKTGYAPEVGLEALREGRKTVPEKNRIFLDAAIANAHNVQPSPYLSLDIPQQFVNTQSNIKTYYGSNSHEGTRG